MERIELSQYAEKLSVEDKDRSITVSRSFCHLYRWQGTAGIWEGLGPAWPTLGNATACICYEADDTTFPKGTANKGLAYLLQNELHIFDYEQLLTIHYFFLWQLPIFSVFFRPLEIYENHTNNVLVCFYSRKPHNNAAFYLPQAGPIPPIWRIVTCPE